MTTAASTQTGQLPTALRATLRGLELGPPKRLQRFTRGGMRAGAPGEVDCGVVA